MNEVQRRRNEFGTPLPTCVTMAWLHDKIEADGTVHNVNKGCSGRPRSSTDDGSAETLLQAFYTVSEEVCKAMLLWDWCLQNQCSSHGMRSGNHTY
jgi:hypothetical protein